MLKSLNVVIRLLFGCQTCLILTVKMRKGEKCQGDLEDHNHTRRSWPFWFQKYGKIVGPCGRGKKENC